MTADQARAALVAFIEAIPVARASRRDKLRHVETGKRQTTLPPRWFTVEFAAARVENAGCLVQSVEYLLSIHEAASPETERRVQTVQTQIANRIAALHLDNADIYDASAVSLGATETDGDISSEMSIVITYVADDALVA